MDASESFKSLAERVQDVYSKKCQTNKTMTEVFEWALNEVLSKHDPVIKAEKAEAKNAQKVKSVTDSQDQSVTDAVTEKQVSKPKVATNQSVTADNREDIPQPILNQVHFRDKGQCSFQKDGKRCNHRRYLHIHHIKPVKDGGKNTVENLTTLCSLHHTYLHHREEIERSLVLLRQFRRELGIRN
jgi:5-methylcytosine-specific restriction endonuclease McrA